MEDGFVSAGTTILALKYRDGVLMAADSRTSSGTYVVSRITNKLDEITENIIFCVSGSAADTLKIRRLVRGEIGKLSLIENKPPSVDKATRMVSRIIYDNKGNGVLAAMIIAGVDTAARINKVNICGTIETGLDIALGGSGSAFITGFCEAQFRPNMELKEAIDFAKTAIGLAIRSDNSSGGVVRIATITKEKITRYFVPGDSILPKRREPTV